MIMKSIKFMKFMSIKFMKSMEIFYIVHSLIGFKINISNDHGKIATLFLLNVYRKIKTWNCHFGAIYLSESRHLFYFIFN